MTTASERRSRTEDVGLDSTGGGESSTTRSHIDRLERAAQSGRAADIYEWAAMLMEGGWQNSAGRPAAPSPKKALPLLKLAAEKGSSMALLKLADWYSDAARTNEQLRASMRLYVRAYRAGEHFAAANLATIFRDKGNTRRERLWLQRAIDMGDRDSALTLAETRLGGRPKEATAARRYLLEKARDSDADIREEAREILAHFERTGHRRWPKGSVGYGTRHARTGRRVF